MRRRFDQRSDGRRPSATLAFVSMLVPLLLTYASPAMAGGSDRDRHHPDHWEAYLAHEGFEGPDCVKIEGESQTNFTAETDYDLVIVKKGSGQNDQRLYWDVGAGTELAPHETQGDGAGYSYVITCVTGEATVPSEGPIADVAVIGACSAEDEFVLSVASANVTVDVDFNADGAFDDEGEIDVAEGTYPIAFVAGIEWRATAHAGAQFAGGATTDSGTIAYLDCVDADVLGVSITSETGTDDTPAEVAAEVSAEAPGEVQAAELPFPGSETGRLIALAALLLGSGTLLLRAVARGGEI